MIRMLFVCMFFSLLACSSEQKTIALNWFTRIDHAPGCGEGNVALIACKDTLLCPIERAFFNGDSLAANSAGKCYFIDLQRITEYKSKADLAEINCDGIKEFVVVGVASWPKQGIYDQRLE